MNQTGILQLFLYRYKSIIWMNRGKRLLLACHAIEWMWGMFLKHAVRFTRVFVSIVEVEPVVSCSEKQSKTTGARSSLDIWYVWNVCYNFLVTLGGGLLIKKLFNYIFCKSVTDLQHTLGLIWGLSYSQASGFQGTETSPVPDKSPVDYFPTTAHHFVF